MLFTFIPCRKAVFLLCEYLMGLSSFILFVILIQTPFKVRVSCFTLSFLHIKLSLWAIIEKRSRQIFHCGGFPKEKCLDSVGDNYEESLQFNLKGELSTSGSKVWDLGNIFNESSNKWK